ncbi:MAG: ribonuclease III [Syntrophobacterales bacterium]|nr:ribonuclease III [Syntrophobacterales bacterium]
MEENRLISESRVKDLNNLAEILSFTFNDISLLDKALTHKSFANENQDLHYNDNERLEFLGDAVLELCITDILMKKFPDDTEGQLSKLRASVVNEQPLAELARQFHVGDFLLLGNGEECSGGRTKNSILANAVEAIIASIYLDGGYEKTLLFINEVFQPLITKWAKVPFYHDYKTSLQEKSQGRFKIIPRYKLVREYGPDHDKTFQIQVSIADIISATGLGKSKKEAEQEAAKKALEELDKIDNGI